MRGLSLPGSPGDEASGNGLSETGPKRGPKPWEEGKFESTGGDDRRLDRTRTTTTGRILELMNVGYNIGWQVLCLMFFKVLTSCRVDCLPVVRRG